MVVAIFRHYLSPLEEELYTRYRKTLIIKLLKPKLLEFFLTK